MRVFIYGWLCFFVCSTCLFGGTLSTSPWTVNADTGISSSKSYTHTVDLGAADVNPSYDGVTFDSVGNSGGVIDGSAYDFSLTSSGGFGDVGGIGNNLESGFSHDIVSDMVYPPNGEMTLTLTGLVPGSSCRLTLYSIGWDSIYERTSLIYGDDDVAPSPDNTAYQVNQNEYGQGNGILVFYDYIAPESGILNVTFQIVAGGGWHFYGFSNDFTGGVQPIQKLSTSEWTTNADTGLSGSKVYSHLIDFGDGAGNPAYNGVTFNTVGNSGGIIDGSAYNFSLTTASGIGGVGGIGSNLESGFSHDIVSDMIYPYDGAMTLTLEGLVPGSASRLTLYSIGWENGDRISLIYGDDGVTPGINNTDYQVNQDEYGQGNGVLVFYDYVVPESGQLNVTFQVVAGGSWHFYGFSNEYKDLVAVDDNDFELVFADNFGLDPNSYPDPNNLPDPNDLSLRQSGPAATIPYLEYNLTEDYSIKDGQLFLEMGRVCLAEDLTGGPLEIQYDITSIGGVSGEWSGLRFGTSKQLGWMTDSGAIGIILRNNGEYQLFDYNGNLTSGYYVSEGQSKDMTGITGTFKVRVEDFVDSRPFNGYGTLRAQFYWTEDGTFGDPFATYVSPDVSKNNIIALLDQNTNTGVYFDNLIVRMVPIPDGDVSGDYAVDIDDITAISGQWLDGQVKGLQDDLIAVDTAGAVIPDAEDAASWNFSLESDGSDVYWSSTGDTLATGYSRYSYVYDVDSVELFDGSVWNDVTEYASLPSEANPTKGGLPITMNDDSLKVTLPLEGSYEISYSCIPVSDWVSLCCCLSGTDRWVASNAEFGFILKMNGLVDFWHSGTSLPGAVFTETYPASLGETVCWVKVVISDSTDNNPFDGVGETNIKVYAGEGTEPETLPSPICDYTEGNGGFTDNFVQFGSGDKAAIGDIKMTFVPVSGDPIDLLTDTLDATGTPNVTDINYNLAGRQTGYAAPTEYSVVAGATPTLGEDPETYAYPLINDGNCFAFSSGARISPSSEIRYGSDIIADLWSYINTSGVANIEMATVNVGDYSAIRVSGTINVQPSLEGWSVVYSDNEEYADATLSVVNDTIQWDINPAHESVSSNSIIYVPETAIDFSEYDKLKLTLNLDTANTDAYLLTMSFYGDFDDPSGIVGLDSTNELVTLNAAAGLYEWTINLDGLSEDVKSVVEAIVLSANAGEVTTDSAIVQVISMTLVDDSVDCELVLLADFDANCIVNLEDFSAIAENWLQGVE